MGKTEREEKEKDMHRLSSLFAVVLAASVVLTACSPNRVADELVAVEIREYEGQEISSINDFRENSIKGPQHISQEDYTLEIVGMVKEPLSLSYELVLDRDQYSKVVTLYCVEGWDATILWEGVLIEDLLDQAGVKDGALIAIFHAEDGYTSSLPLDMIREHDLLLAHKMNGATLPPERGFPFQVVAESKWGYKWVKWVTKIELSDDAEYRGFWEERGYNNDGDIDGPIFENRSR
jgi:DMSO/TMAO reductase YedYZ molybdopterin-dependent catalytic subunit